MRLDVIIEFENDFQVEAPFHKIFCDLNIFMDYNNNDEFVIMFQLTLWSDDNTPTHSHTHRAKIIDPKLFISIQNVKICGGHANLLYCRDQYRSSFVLYHKILNIYLRRAGCGGRESHSNTRTLVTNSWKTIAYQCKPIDQFCIHSIFGFSQGSFVRNDAFRRFSLSFEFYLSDAWWFRCYLFSIVCLSV